MLGAFYSTSSASSRITRPSLTMWRTSGSTRRRVSSAHRGRIMEKLNLHSMGELVRFAMRNGLID